MVAMAPRIEPPDCAYNDLHARAADGHAAGDLTLERALTPIANPGAA